MLPATEVLLSVKVRLDRLCPEAMPAPGFVILLAVLMKNIRAECGRIIVGSSGPNPISLVSNGQDPNAQIGGKDTAYHSVPQVLLHKGRCKMLK